MEMCEGVTLHNFIKRYPLKHLSEDKAKEVIREITKAVAYLHSLNIVHRDLKLENILAQESREGEVILKLIDFGFATVCKPTQKLDLHCGTLSYMDPDLVKQRRYLGQAADVWAIGVIAYTLVTGKVPFWGKDENELIFKISTLKFSTPNDHKYFSPGLKKLFS